MGFGEPQERSRSEHRRVLTVTSFVATMAKETQNPLVVTQIPQSPMSTQPQNRPRNSAEIVEIELLKDRISNVFCTNLSEKDLADKSDMGFEQLAKLHRSWECAGLWPGNGAGKRTRIEGVASKEGRRVLFHSYVTTCWIKRW